jgi:hypothetical protein
MTKIKKLVVPLMSDNEKDMMQAAFEIKLTENASSLFMQIHSISKYINIVVTMNLRMQTTNQSW